MEAILEHCCGLYVHRDTVVVCLLTGSLDRRPKKEIRTFSTMSKGLHERLAWLNEANCSHIAMESTGVYRKPVYHVLEGSMNIKLANAQRIKNVPDRKTDIADSEWIAKLLRSACRHSRTPRTDAPSQEAVLPCECRKEPDPEGS